jgi:hypothetical protein
MSRATIGIEQSDSRVQPRRYYGPNGDRHYRRDERQQPAGLVLVDPHVMSAAWASSSGLEPT